jgi:16S rRNA (cytidine1402-2'-O)-methyltransferase
MENQRGKLYLVPTLLGDSAPERNIPAFNTAIIAGIRDFIVEELKVARAFLKMNNYKIHFDEVNFYLLDEQTAEEDTEDYLQAAMEGRDIGLLSGAGLPCLADPGAIIVRRAHQLHIPVIPLIGPSSIYLALMASGFNGQNFTFHGYLPVDKQSRNKKIKELEKRIQLENQTQIFIETPYRNNQMLAALLDTCSNATQLCVACNITAENELIISKAVSVWKKETRPDLNKRPAVFLLYS